MGGGSWLLLVMVVDVGIGRGRLPALWLWAVRNGVPSSVPRQDGCLLLPEDSDL